jgi:hypothetical protein
VAIPAEVGARTADASDGNTQHPVAGVAEAVYGTIANLDAAEPPG